MTGTTQDDDLHQNLHARRQVISFLAAIGLTLPALFATFTGWHPDSHLATALVFGLAIVGAAFILSWAAEVAQLDISAGLAIAVLAFIAVLPEYAVDLVFARKGGNAVEEYGTSCRPPGSEVESPCSLALANMTGANRLLIGVGWTMVVFVAWWAWRKQGEPNNDGITLERSHSIELSYLAVAGAYSLTLPLKSSITLLDSAVLIGIFLAYTYRIAKAPAETPHLVGPARWIGNFETRKRRSTYIALFFFAAAVILLSAETFAEALVETGVSLNISEFFLVQWVAPFASEAPELIIAGLYAWRLNTNAGLGTLVSSKVNQWTLLVGTLPIAFALAAGSFDGLPIVARQREELLLTAAQTVFAVALLSNLTLSIKEAWALLGLFMGQFLLASFFESGVERLLVAGFYMLTAIIIVARDRKRIKRLFKDGFRSTYAELEAP